MTDTAKMAETYTTKNTPASLLQVYDKGRRKPTKKVRQQGQLRALSEPFASGERV